MTEQPNPDMDWYQGISSRRKLTPRCPFASLERCPRFFQSIALLGDAGLSTKISPEEDERLQKCWENSDLWPKTAEMRTSTFGSSKCTGGFSNFCPEVSYDRFGFFASGLFRYADEIDVELAHERLGREGVPGTDWRWSWAALSPKHFTECPFYSLLSPSGEYPGGTTVGAVEAQLEVEPKRDIAPKKEIARGRPLGSGMYPGDEALLDEAIARRSDGRATSDYAAIMHVAGDPNEPKFVANVERLRKKLRKRRRAQTGGADISRLRLGKNRIVYSQPKVPK